MVSHCHPSVPNLEFWSETEGAEQHLGPHDKAHLHTVEAARPGLLIGTHATGISFAATVTWL